MKQIIFFFSDCKISVLENNAVPECQQLHNNLEAIISKVRVS